MAIVGMLSDKELDRHKCLKSADKVPGNPETTAFKRRARLHQALWREARNLPIGAHPVSSTHPKNALGSRFDHSFAFRSWANFLNDDIRQAVEYRLGHPEKHQMLNRSRLMCDLLSSMPMCFNLFGWLHSNLEAADHAVHQWWPDVPERVSAVRFEWSPGRRICGAFLENRSAFDVAFELAFPDGSHGVVGIETKYHEHCRREKPPAESRLRRYEEVTRNSGVFEPRALDAIAGTHLQQIWLDHLLALSMLQHPNRQWKWVKFVLVHPEKNPSFAKAAAAYAKLLADRSTFEVRTIESLLDNGVLPAEVESAFRTRYLW